MDGSKHIREVSIDIMESNLFSQAPGLLQILLKDHTTQKNIFWATDDYKSLGSGFDYMDEIKPDKITGKKGFVIMPRVFKEKPRQQARVRDKAEVFTPSWICNAQNNLVDNAWFGHENIFNTEFFEEGAHFWTITEDKIQFPEGKTWKSYVKSTRLEITCGEAPYLASRYDTTTGDVIPVRQRIGLLDRKLRIVAENTSKIEEWHEWAKIAYQHIYGFEWQGDNLLLAREALLYTYIDFYADRFLKYPSLDKLKEIAEIISWNLWQMDGLKGVVPDSCHEETSEMYLFDENEVVAHQCPGCEKNDISQHNGQQCLIMDWEKNEAVKYTSLTKR